MHRQTQLLVWFDTTDTTLHTKSVLFRWRCVGCVLAVGGDTELNSASLTTTATVQQRARRCVSLSEGGNTACHAPRALDAGVRVQIGYAFVREPSVCTLYMYICIKLKRMATPLHLQT